MCIYGMEGPGGYAISAAPFRSGTPDGTPICSWPSWGLVIFYQIKFFEVTTEELDDARDKFPTADLRSELNRGATSRPRIPRLLRRQCGLDRRLPATQRAAFAAERAEWAAKGLNTFEEREREPAP